MAAIHDLFSQIDDVRLRERLAREWEEATRHKKFGLVFEQHLPELVPLWNSTPRKGDLVAHRTGKLTEAWRVRRIEGNAAELVCPRKGGERESAAEHIHLPIADLVVVKQFGDPIYPTITPIDSVANGPNDAPWHAVIPDRFYVVIDEAHRGMGRTRGNDQAQSIVQRFIKGHTETALIQMPLIIGVSATPRRFNDLLADTNHTHHKVQVPPEQVRASGLLKERILIHHPDAPTKAELGLLEEAARRWVTVGKEWMQWAEEEGEKEVRPILVVQVEDGTENQLTRTDLDAAVRAIEDAIGRTLSNGELAHAFQESADIRAGDRPIRKLDASRIEEDPEIAVVFFKMALSTGWDCPRAEIMMSFRRAQDHTYIAQLLGRMVRTPLARRIERKAQLNDVHLFLPHFDNAAVDQVIAALQNSEEVPPAEAADARELVILNRLPGTEAIFQAMEGLVTYRVGAHRAQSDIRRYQEIARRLTIDGIDEAAWDKAKSDAACWFGEQVQALKAAGTFEAERNALTHVTLSTVAVDHATGVAEERADYVVEASDFDIQRQFEEAGRVLGNGLHLTYRKANAKRDTGQVKLELIIVCRTNSAIAALETKSRAEFNTFYDRYKSAITSLKEHQRLAYDRLRASSTVPQSQEWHLPDTIDFRRDPADPVWSKHLYVEDDGSFRADLGTWEAGVLAEELADSETVAWLRNVDRKSWALEIPYRHAGKARSMFPDLVTVRKKGDDLLFDILEPHDPSLADNVDKARGLAAFAEQHGALFGRIQLIRRGKSVQDGSGFARLDLNRTDVQDEVRLVSDRAQLDALFSKYG